MSLTEQPSSEPQLPATRDELRGTIHAPTLQETGFANAPRSVRDPVEGILKILEQATKSFGKINESLVASSLDAEGINKLIGFAGKAGINSRFVTDFLQNIERSGGMILKQVRSELGKRNRQVAPDPDSAKNDQQATEIQNELTRLNDACPQGRLNGERFGKAIAAEISKTPEPAVLTLAAVLTAAKAVTTQAIAEYQRTHAAAGGA